MDGVARPPQDRWLHLFLAARQALSLQPGQVPVGGCATTRSGCPGYPFLASRVLDPKGFGVGPIE